MQRASQKISSRKTESDSRLVTAVLEYIQGIGVVRSYNLDKEANKTVDQAVGENEAINYQMEKTFIPYMCMQSIVLKLFGVGVILLSVGLYLGGSMELLSCLLLVIASFLVYAQLDTAGSYSALLRVMDLSIDKINGIFDTPVMDIGGKDIRPEHLDITGSAVGFSYDRQKIIDGADFKIPAGTTTAVVGPSGSGKTTLCHLMARFWDVDEGGISLGGHDVREYTLDSLLEHYSMVFQNVYLFNDTIANNIKFVQ
ncbi:MAG: ABC transporter ATP-binding protein/permease, partial [Clostridiales bacterium]|nr:ABC transporter ATP-binding protein/permease [Clostridiales bacterium]